ncbi:hypothetical protein [Asticcacaulis sp. YBE204]|uniref:hypothetical protein n=1 Tax=Asticcacaulis sp. YBE204 TaxID=1282363 RepID=UPI0003C3C7FF|nr:hypothetical protein [Asticcacaulis sp. YBE204]ESQ77532.1 hypothetical protein AEYBE204_17485 [Asticcacaulis sp. YBE204]
MKLKSVALAAIGSLCLLSTNAVAAEAKIYCKSDSGPMLLKGVDIHVLVKAYQDTYDLQSYYSPVQYVENMMVLHFYNLRCKQKCTQFDYFVSGDASRIQLNHLNIVLDGKRYKSEVKGDELCQITRDILAGKKVEKVEGE